jgi:hypothetical protein
MCHSSFGGIVNLKKHPALILIFTALLVTVCRCSADGQFAMQFTDGTIIGCKEYLEYFSEENPSSLLANSVYVCSLPCPDGSVAKFDLYENPSSGVQDKVEYQKQYCQPAEQATQTLQPTETSTAAPTATKPVLATGTPSPVPTFSVLDAEVAEGQVACRYGPGDLYLYEYGLIEGNKMEVLGRDINSEWLFVQVDGFEKPCWVRAESINMNGDVASLEPVYPGKVNIPLSYLWPAPQNVSASRTADGKKVGIYWDEYILPDGEMESPQSPRYLLELWLCKDGTLAFNSMFAWENSLLVTDEAGCSEPSSGVIYLVEKHGYSGPVTIPWPSRR